MMTAARFWERQSASLAIRGGQPVVLTPACSRSQPHIAPRPPPPAVFNLLVSLGLPMGLAALQHGGLDYAPTAGMVLLIGGSILVLAALLLLIPIGFRWRLDRTVGLTMLLLYAFCQLIFLLVEEADSPEGHV